MNRVVKAGKHRHAARVCASVLLCLSLAGCEPEPAAVLDAPVESRLEVSVVELQAQDWQGVITAYGVVQAAEQVNISLDFSGVVKRVLVDEGERVERGQVLLELDTDKQKLRVSQAGENVQRARAAMKEARLNLERRQQLAAQKTVSREVLDNAELALKRSAADYREALASLQLARRVLEDSHVRSPVDGLVESRSVEPGESVMTGSALLKLQTQDLLEVLVWISESDIAYINKGDGATVRLSGLPGQVLAARVESIGVNAHPATGNYPLELLIEQETVLVRPGMTATAEIEGISFPDVLLLPEQALVDRNRRKVVFVERDGRARQVEPLLGAGFSDRLMILSGLESGDRVIVTNLQRVVDGSDVTVVAGDSLENLEGGGGSGAGQGASR